MKKILVLLIPVFLSGCNLETELAVKRSEVVKVCNDGTLVGYDKETQQYTVAKGRWVGIVSKQVELENICQETN